MIKQKKLNTELMKAAKKGDLVNVKSLIEEGADIHSDSDLALRWSASMGHLDIVKYLIEQGAAIHANAYYALRMSANQGNLEIVKYLIEQGAYIHADDDEALRFSALNHHLEVVKYLIIDCNMVTKKETLDYLAKHNLVESINIINIRDLHNRLEDNLSNGILNKTKTKI